ncbi:MAG: lytic transglycosylase domain-containing protein [Candidatus Parcubacteria bacterium]|nr:lytic transglycosylase domain-containing protein [Candidatus Paceibacterota bacterium]
MSPLNKLENNPKNTPTPSVERIKKHSYRLALSAGIMVTLNSCASVGGSSESATATVAEELVNAMITQESGGNQSAVSPDGAIGLVQIMEGTGKQYCSDLKWRKDPAANIKCGGRIVTAYASQLKIPLTTTITYEQCLTLLRAYNSGVQNAHRTVYNLDEYGNATISNTKHAEIVCKAVNPAVISNSKAINPVVVPKAPLAKSQQKQTIYSQPSVQTVGFPEKQCNLYKGTWDAKAKLCR